jgi:hypothetical protein
VKFSAASRLWADAAAVALLKAAVTALVLWSGFRAVSDDDYARVVIAQRFAEAPVLDPTGTSWLPLPFYVYGGVMRVLGSSLDVARGVAVALGIVSALLVFAAARWLGLGRWATLLGSALAAAFPYSAYLGAATVPEAPVAALTLLAAATLGRGSSARLLGAAALFAATGARYEPWALAPLFAGFCLVDARRQGDGRYLLAAGLALAFPISWLLHGVFVHGDATFFVSRVAAYRAALGADVGGAFERWWRTPRAFVTGEPELALLLFGVALPVLLRSRPTLSSPWLRFCLALSAVVALSMAADVRGTAPTHHGERALLTPWLGICLLLAAAVERLPRLTSRARLECAAGALTALLLGLVLRHQYPRTPFVDRSSAVDIGEQARRLGAERLAIDAGDFAFLALQAGFGRPSRTLVLDDRDPRKPRPPDLLRLDARQFAAALSRERIGWLALPSARAPLARAVGRANGENADWVLLELSEH